MRLIKITAFLLTLSVANASAAIETNVNGQLWGLDILVLKMTQNTDNTSTGRVSTHEGNPVAEIDFDSIGQILKIRTFNAEGAWDEESASEVLSEPVFEVVFDPLKPPSDPVNTKGIQAHQPDDSLLYREVWEGSKGQVMWVKPNKYAVMKTIYPNKIVETRWEYPDGRMTDQTSYPNGTRQVDAYQDQKTRLGDRAQTHIYREYAIGNTSVIFSRTVLPSG